jgi:hypothetical protein
MGFFDTVKEKAGAFATDAERAGRVTAAQARLLVLQNDLRKAERDLGHAAAALIEAGAALHPDLGPSAARVRETRDALLDKEAEIAALRAGGATSQTTAPVAAAAPPVEEAAVETPPARPAATKPAARKQAAKKPATKKTPAKKTPAKKTAGGTKAAAAKTAPTRPAVKKPAAGKPPASTE